MFAHVPPQYIDVIWPAVKGLLASAIAKNLDEEDLGQVRLQIISGQRHLVVWHENDSVVSAAVIEFIPFPNYTVAHCHYLSGKYTPESFDALKAWCFQMGASKIQCAVDDATARLYNRYGLVKAYNILRIDL